MRIRSIALVNFAAEMLGFLSVPMRFPPESQIFQGR